MTGERKEVRWYLVLLVLNLAVIWGNSLLPAEESANLSGFFSDVLKTLFPDSTGGIPLRKAAHFIEFACLGMILTHTLIKKKKDGARPVPQTLVGCLLAACLDETIQIFVVGRGSSLLDVGIDFCGAAVGMLILLFGHYVSKQHTNTEEMT